LYRKDVIKKLVFSVRSTVNSYRIASLILL